MGLKWIETTPFCKTSELNDVFLRHGIAGGLAAFPTSLLSVPAERVKIMMQMDSKLSIKDAVQKVMIDGGIAGAYRGMLITIKRDFVGCFVWFGSYEYMKAMLRTRVSSITEYSNNARLPVWAIMTAGSIAGAVSWTVSLPFDIIKSRIQYSAIKISSFEACTILMEEGKIAARREMILGCSSPAALFDMGQPGLLLQVKHYVKSFYRGYSFAMMRAIPANAISWVAVEFMINLLKDTPSITTTH